MAGVATSRLARKSSLELQDENAIVPTAIPQGPKSGTYAFPLGEMATKRDIEEIIAAMATKVDNTFTINGAALQGAGINVNAYGPAGAKLSGSYPNPSIPLLATFNNVSVLPLNNSSNAATPTTYCKIAEQYDDGAAWNIFSFLGDVSCANDINEGMSFCRIILRIERGSTANSNPTLSSGHILIFSVSNTAGGYPRVTVQKEADNYIRVYISGVSVSHTPGILTTYKWGIANIMPIAIGSVISSLPAAGGTLGTFARMQLPRYSISTTTV